MPQIMKYIIYITLLFCFTIAACQQVPNKEAMNQIVNGVKEGKWVQYVTELDSVVKDTNSPCFREVIFYKAGVPYGKAGRYYKSGKIFSEGTYINGRIKDALKCYYESGALLAETPTPDDNGKLNGIAKWYYESGKLQTEIPYVNGKVNGVKKIYYENGKLQEEDPKTDGEINGTVRIYYESGKLKEEDIYVVGKISGGKLYYEDGKLKAEVTYTNGIQGTPIYYDENGKEVK